MDHYPFYEVFMLNSAFHCFLLGGQGVWILGQLPLGISQPQTNEQSLSLPEASAREDFQIRVDEQRPCKKRVSVCGIHDCVFIHASFWNDK